jgi:hypothetical protein
LRLLYRKGRRRRTMDKIIKWLEKVWEKIGRIILGMK